MEDRIIDCNWAIVDVEVSMSDHKIHDIGALRYDGAVYHGCKKEDLFDFLHSVNFLCGHNIVGAMVPDPTVPNTAPREKLLSLDNITNSTLICRR